MRDNSNQRLEKLIVALLRKVQDHARNGLENDNAAVLSWNVTSILEHDPSSVRVDLTVNATFSLPRDDDEPRASGMSVASDSNSVQFQLFMPTWLDELAE